MKSHANVASTFFLGQTPENPNDVCLFPPGMFESPEHERKYMGGILYCLKYLLNDIQDRCGYDFGVEWQYDAMELFKIAGSGHPGKDGRMEVVASRINSTYQTLMLLKLANIQVS